MIDDLELTAVKGEDSNAKTKTRFEGVGVPPSS
jgi:hypothetical protein